MVFGRPPVLGELHDCSRALEKRLGEGGLKMEGMSCENSEINEAIQRGRNTHVGPGPGRMDVVHEGALERRGIGSSNVRRLEGKGPCRW